MPQEIPVDLTATGGRLVPPGTPVGPPRVPPRPRPPAPTEEVPTAKTKPADPEPEPKHDHTFTGLCRYCGWPQAIDPSTPSPADVVAFRAAVFSGEPFGKEIDLFDGAASVTFRDLSGEELVAANALTAGAVLKNPARATPEGVESLRTDFRLGLSVTTLRIGKNIYTGAEVADPNEEDLQARHEKVRKACGSETVYRAVRMEYTKFLAALGVIIARSTERNFFSATGTGGGTPASPSAA